MATFAEPVNYYHPKLIKIKQSIDTIHFLYFVAMESFFYSNLENCLGFVGVLSKLNLITSDFYKELFLLYLLVLGITLTT
jgi:uncharacterized membrane protein